MTGHEAANNLAQRLIAALAALGEPRATDLSAHLEIRRGVVIRACERLLRDKKEIDDAWFAWQMTGDDEPQEVWP